MPIAIALDDVRATQARHDLEGGALLRTSFIEKEGSPQAFIAQYDPHRVSRAHFHQVDQFQIVIEGKGMIGRHELLPYSVHFARAHTPYGPLVAAAEGMTFLTLRRSYDVAGPQRLPEAKAALERVPDRRPWQVTRQIAFGAQPQPAQASGVLFDAIAGVRDDEGLAGYCVEMQPGAKAYAPDPSRGEGQFVVVLEGSLLHGGREHKAITLVSIASHEGPYQVQAGPLGLKGLVLTFPRAESRQPVAAESPLTRLKTWQCVLCAFVYDEETGLPDEGIAAGTRWGDVPDSWTCPDCAASKSDFQMVEL
jgi:rubredoxin